MQCPNPACRRVWRYTGDSEWICCPSCHRKFRRPAPVVEVLGEQIATDTPCDICCGDVGAVYPCRIDGEAAYLCPECLGKLKGDST